MSKQKGLAPILIVILIAAAIGGYFIYTNNSSSQNQKETKISKSDGFDIVVKENNTDKAKSDIYLKAKNSGKETLFITITDVYRGHYYNSEFKNGNLYIIRRTGGDLGYENNPNWTDELWRYDSSKKGTKLYSNRGLDFRVSDDDKLIAIVGSGLNNAVGENIVFINSDGNKIKKYEAGDIGINNINPLLWRRNDFWVTENAGPTPMAFVTIDTNSFEFIKFDAEGLEIGTEFDLNPDSKKLAYSNYPTFFDADSAKEYEQSGKKVTLTVYDLVSEQKQEIVTSITKKFNPKWVDSNTLEYDNPTGEGRILVAF